MQLLKALLLILLSANAFGQKIERDLVGKIAGNNNNLGRLAYGTNQLGEPDYNSIILSKWDKEAEHEAIIAAHAIYAEEMSGVDPTGLNYTFNPIASAKFDFWMLEAASTTSEERWIKAGMALDFILTVYPVAKGLKTKIKVAKRLKHVVRVLKPIKGEKTVAAKTGK